MYSFIFNAFPQIETSKTLGYVKIRRSDHRVDICKDYHG